MGCILAQALWLTVQGKSAHVACVPRTALRGAKTSVQPIAPCASGSAASHVILHAYRHAHLAALAPLHDSSALMPQHPTRINWQTLACRASPLLVSAVQEKDLPIGEIVQKATLKKVLLSEQKVRTAGLRLPAPAALTQLLGRQLACLAWPAATKAAVIPADGARSTWGRGQTSAETAATLRILLAVAYPLFRYLSVQGPAATCESSSMQCPAFGARMVALRYLITVRSVIVACRCLCWVWQSTRCLHGTWLLQRLS